MAEQGAVSTPPESSMDDSNERSPGSGRVPKAASPPGEKPARKAGGTSPLRIYKPGQGAYVRWGTAAGVGIVSVAGADFVFKQMARFDLKDMLWVKFFVPVTVVVALFYLIYRFVGRNETVVNFMIATESEMKKVNWSTRREVIGATKIVIVTTLALAAILFFVDILFMLLFSWMDVLQIDLIGNIFGTGEGS